MKEQKTTSEPISTEQYSVVDQMRAAFMAGVAKQYIQMLIPQKTLPSGMNRNVLKQTNDQLERFIREVRRTVPEHKPNYMDRNLDENKLLDLATIIDSIARIGIEERSRFYEEFFGLLVDCIDVVFYSQQHRKNIHFPKYKALFQLFVSEMKSDVNKQPGQVFYSPKGELFLRTAPPIQSPQMK